MMVIRVRDFLDKKRKTVEVVVGPRAEGYFPVVRGLESGQVVAAAGAFLIDAETRLNPSAGAAYFGGRKD